MIVSDERAEAFTVVGGSLEPGLLILCDHASNALPDEYGSLGLAAEQFSRHIAYDIGAAEVTRQIAAAFEAPALLTHYSRLLIDPNRGEDDPTLIMRLSDGAIVPGNRHLDAAERERRLARFYLPYHAAIGRLIDKSLAAGMPPVLVSIHSFTENWKGVPRPWQVGILWDEDPRLAHALLEGFRGFGDLVVGDNQPYSGKLPGDTMWKHGTCRGLAHAIIEIRQDLIGDAAGQAVWADRVVGVLRRIFGTPALMQSLRERWPPQ